MRKRPALGELACFAQRETRIRERQSLDGGGRRLRKEITTISQLDTDVNRLQDHEIAIKIADPHLETAYEGRTKLRSLGEKTQ